MFKLTILAAAALVTSIISAIIGMGGGILLLAVMFCFMDHAEAIPAHGAVQLISNGTRLLAFVNHVHWKTVCRFILGALPGAVLGIGLIYWLRQGQIEKTEPYLKMLIGLYVLIMTIKSTPKTKQNNQSKVSQATSGPQPKALSFAGFGFLAGGMGLTIGAIGPLIAPVFIHSNFVKEKLIATKAVCQAFIHLLKIPAFLVLGKEFVEYNQLVWVIVVMGVLVIPGTLIGKKILTQVNERLFIILFKGAMFLAGAKVFCYDGVFALI